MKVLLKILYIPVKRHKKRRIEKKWGKKYGYIERRFWARSEMCEIRLSRYNDDWGIRLKPTERGIIQPEPGYKIEADLRKIELVTEDKHITWDELEKRRREEQW